MPTDGTAIGNYRLMQDLSWTEDRYWKVRDRLVDEGKVALGRGRGGTVRLLKIVPAVPELPLIVSPPGAVIAPCAPVLAPLAEREIDLYAPLGETLRQQWRSERRLDNFLVEVTALQGKRPTGGVWTRPDLTGVSVRRFAHVPGV